MRILLPFFLIFNFCAVSILTQTEVPNKDTQEANSLSSQSGRLYSSRQYDSALELAQKELNLREKIGDEQYIASVYFNIGGIYREKGDFDKAVKYFDKAILFYRKVFGENHVKVFNAYNQTARVLILKDDKTRAVQLLNTALPIAENLFGKESRKVADQHLAIAQVLKHMKRNQESEQSYQKAILMSDKLLKTETDDDRPDVDEYMCFLLSIHRFDENWDGFNKKRNDAENSSQSEIINGKAIKLVRPQPPSGKRNSYSTSKIIVRVLIDETGNIIRARSVCTGNESLMNASLKAAYQSKFSPTLINNEPAQVTGVIVYNFVN